MKTNFRYNGPRYSELILTVSVHNFFYFVLLLAVSKNYVMIQMVYKPNTTPVGQDKETLTFKALLYLNVAVYTQVCRLFCVLCFPLFSLVQLGYPTTTDIFLLTR